MSTHICTECKQVVEVQLGQEFGHGPTCPKR